MTEQEPRPPINNQEKPSTRLKIAAVLIAGIGLAALTTVGLIQNPEVTKAILGTIAFGVIAVAIASHTNIRSEG